jgi:hypothetical protein
MHNVKKTIIYSTEYINEQQYDIITMTTNSETKQSLSGC